MEESKINSSNLQMISSLFIGLFFIIIGLPLWWKTTTTYRATLPHNDIHTLAQKELICTIPVTLITCHQNVSPDQLKFTAQVFEDVLNRETTLVAQFHTRYTVSSRGCSEQETTLLKFMQTFEDDDEPFGLVEGGPPVEPQVYLVPDHSWDRYDKMFVGKHNTLFAVVEKSGSSFPELLEGLAMTLKETVFNQQSLASTYITSRGVRLKKADPDTVRALQSTPGYELSFSLMNSDPSEVVARWNIAEAVQDYVQPFLDKLTSFAQFSVSSQILYYSELPLSPKKSKDKGYYVLTAPSLPLLINPMESKLGSDVSNHPTLNFVVFIPSTKHTPLHIHDKKGHKVDTNAFFSPRWGGIQVQNPPPLEENSTRPAEYAVDVKSAMSVYLSQLRLLIGIPKQKSTKEVTFAAPGQLAITEWELQNLFRKRTVENIATATNTLYSLSRLLEKINNMVINDEVAAEVYSAVDCLHRAHDSLANGELSRAFQFSKRAIGSAEKAFFDPSLLELLYFPEDQKFAIYIPLFLPVGIPIIVSLFKAVKWLMAKRKEKQS